MSLLVEISSSRINVDIDWNSLEIEDHILIAINKQNSIAKHFLPTEQKNPTNSKRKTSLILFRRANSKT